MFRTALIIALTIAATASTAAESLNVADRRVAEAPISAPIPSPISPPGMRHVPAPNSASTQDPKTMEVAAIAAVIIAASVVGYTGNCSCPQNTDKAGRSCGKRAAYHRPGGWKPLCFTTDVTLKMIDRFRQTGTAAEALALIEQP